jgi:hypothetical protein
MMTAKEARQKTNEINSLKEREQLKKIEALINSNIMSGTFCYYGTLIPNVETHLVNLGYVVNRNKIVDPKDGPSVIISW